MRALGSLLGRGYGYPVWLRALEVAGLVAFAGFAFALASSVVSGARLEASRPYLGWILVAVPVAAWVAADFLSGLVHFLADNFGRPETPILGPAFVRPFREHHVDPEGITRHDFVEVNGASSLVSLSILAPAALWLPVEAGPGWLAAGVFLLSLLLFVLLTNQIHRWAHMKEPPRVVAWLQRARVILSPEVHQIHHTRPFNRYYCITAGWLNPILERTRFFDALEGLLRRLSPRAAPDAQKPAP